MNYPNQGGSFPGQIPLSPQGQPMIPGQVPFQQGQPQAPVGWPGQQGGISAVPQYPVAPQNPAGSGMNGDAILDGPGIPAELRGRKVADVMRIYSALAEDFLTRRRGAAPVGNQQQQQVPQNQQQQGQQQPPRNQQGQFAGQNFQVPANGGQGDPEADKLAGVVRQIVGEAVLPFQQQNNMIQISSALGRARQGIPDFQQLEPEIMEVVKGASEESMIRDDFWVSAADMIRGRRMRSMQANRTGSTAPGFQTQLPQPQVSVGYPQAMVPTQPQLQPGMNPNIPMQMQQQRPHTGTFFSEAPTAPSPFQNSFGATQLTPAEMHVANVAGIPHDQYAAWKAANQAGGR